MSANICLHVMYMIFQNIGWREWEPGESKAKCEAGVLCGKMSGYTCNQYGNRGIQCHVYIGAYKALVQAGQYINNTGQWPGWQKALYGVMSV